MSDLEEIKAALVVDGTPFKVVSGAAGFAAAREMGVKTHPAAFVYFGDEVSGENIGGTGPVMQLQERDLSVVYVFGDLSSAGGGSTADEAETIKSFARGVLIGKVLSDDPSNNPITHVEGGLGDFKNGLVWYEDKFSVPTYLKEQN